MANPFVKAWKYVMALFNAKIDEHADPKVQIQQAIEEAQRQHQALTQQAAQVIGNQRQLEMRLNRQLADIGHQVVGRQQDPYQLVPRLVEQLLQGETHGKN